jgi:hypothetical protein
MVATPAGRRARRVSEPHAQGTGNPAVSSLAGLRLSSWGARTYGDLLFPRLGTGVHRAGAAPAAGALLLAALGCRDDAGSPTEPRPAPQGTWHAATTLTFRQVSAGEFHTCGVIAENRAYCWSANGMGRLGTGTITGLETCSEAACSTKPLAVAGGCEESRRDSRSRLRCAAKSDPWPSDPLSA